MVSPVSRENIIKAVVADIAERKSTCFIHWEILKIRLHNMFNLAHTAVLLILQKKNHSNIVCGGIYQIRLTEVSDLIQIKAVYSTAGHYLSPLAFHFMA